MNAAQDALNQQIVEEWLVNAPASLRSKIFEKMQQSDDVLRRSGRSSSTGSLSTSTAEHKEPTTGRTSRRMSPSASADAQQTRQLIGGEERLQEEVPALSSADSKRNFIRLWLDAAGPCDPCDELEPQADILVVEHQEEAPLIRTGSGRRSQLLPSSALPHTRHSRQSGTASPDRSSLEKSHSMRGHMDSTVQQATLPFLSRRRAIVQAAPMALESVRPSALPRSQAAAVPKQAVKQQQPRQLSRLEAVPLPTEPTSCQLAAVARPPVLRRSATQVPEAALRRATLADSLVPCMVSRTRVA